MKNKRVPTLWGIIILLVVAGGVFWYLSNANQTEELSKTETVQNQENNIQQQNTQKPEKTNTSKVANIEYNGFSFNVNDPSIVHPFTKALAEKKNQITEKEIVDAGGKLFYEDSSQKIIRFELFRFAEDDEDDYLYVYTKNNSNLITGILIYDEPTPELVLNLVPNYLNNIKPTMPILKSPSGDVVENGHYFASIESWNSAENELEVDFLTPSEIQPERQINVDFDILMSSLSPYGPENNKKLENNTINIRAFDVSNKLKEEINWGDGTFNSGGLYLWKGAQCLIEIKGEVIIKIEPVVFAN